MKLDVLRNNQNIASIDLGKDIESLGGESVSFFIGRSEDCHVHLNDQQVSREHAVINYRAGSWSIEKNSSVGQIKVNGLIVEQSTLSQGDSVEIGPFVIGVSGVGPSRNEQASESSAAKETATESLKDEGEGAATETHFASEEEKEDEVVEDQAGLSSEDETAPNISGDNEELGSSEEGDEVEEFDSGEAVFDKNSDDDESDEPAPDFTSSDFGEVGEGEGVEVSDNEEADAFDFSGEAGEEENIDDFGGGFDVVDSVGDGTQVIQAFAKFELEIFGEYAPFDKYLIDKKEVLIGRDPEKCDIVLNDPEVSSTHALIKKTNIDCTLEDLKSGNGTLLNGSRINSSSISANDEFIIGSTTFTVKVGSDLLSQQEDKLMPVDENQEIEVEEVIEVDADFGEGDFAEEGADELAAGEFKPEAAKPTNQSLFSKEALQDPERRKKLLIIAVVLLGLWTLLDEGSDDSSTPSEQQADTDRDRSRDLDDDGPDEEMTRELTAEERQQAESIYQLAREFFDQGRYSETIFELQKLFAITPDYKSARQIDSLAKQGLARLEEIERERQREIERQERQKRIADLVERAQEAVEKRRVEAAESYFVQILELDPQNFEVPQMRIELEAWQKEQDRIAMEKAEREAERNRMERALEPGRHLYSRQEWYRAIHELEEFLSMSNLDEDLVEEASEMLDESKEKLDTITQPLLGRARSLREGRDLKGAYEAYREIVDYFPSHQEAITEMDAIEDRLLLRSRRIYREALIAESLSLFDAAREKFQEVQQVSPSDSEYYIKATEKLREYLE